MTTATEQIPPFGSKRKAAMAVYTPPFKYVHGFIYDADNHMVADDGCIGSSEPTVEKAIAARIRGWGRIGYMPNAAELQDEVGAMVSDALNAYYAHQLVYEWVGALQEHIVALQAQNAELTADAARYRMITADHDDRHLRIELRSICESLGVRGKGYSDKAIDDLIKEQAQ